ncbi:MAG TPA: acyltransferase [Terriglobales bacterium]|nr:acyltransferase [Terriglobales bacterium]
MPSLDGLRAASLACVLLAHLSGTQHFFRWEMFEIYGDFGVRVFFLISGHLITGLLLKEHEKTGSISLRDFYLRRAYRILPAAYVYMIVVIASHWHTLSWASMVAAVTYTSNYLRDEPWVLGHLWSLSVEEQFYLLWPLTLAVFFRKKLWVVVGLLLSGPPLRVLFWIIWGYHGLAHFFPVLMDALGAGCALAMLHPQLQNWDRWLRNRWFLLVPALTALLPLLHFVSNRSYQVAGLTVMHIGIALSIQQAVQMRYRVLNWGQVVWMGTLSYSFYLWQQPFLNRTSRDWWAAFPQNLLLVGLFGAASYYCVEKPFLGLRERRKEEARADRTLPGKNPFEGRKRPGPLPASLEPIAEWAMRKSWLPQQLLAESGVTPL